jgi:antitoxin HicB
LAYAPALEGCVTHGSSPQEALRNGLEAAQLWLDSAVKHGHFIPKPASQYSGRLTLRMPRSLHERIAEEAEREGVSINQWVLTKLAG